MKKLLLLSAAFFVFAVAANAQGYRTSLGVRLGSSAPAIKNGITLKHFIGNNAIEAILSFGDGAALCGLYEMHKPLASDKLQWLIGFGGYVGLSNQTTTRLGAAGIIGLDYKFNAVPLNLTLDWKPELNIVSKVGFESSGIGFSARYTF